MSHPISQQTQGFLRQTHGMHINGMQVFGDAKKSLISPIDGKDFATVTVGDKTHVDMAVQSATDALHTPDWANMKGAERAKILWKIADLIEQHMDILAELDTLCMGKPINDAKFGEIPFTAEAFRYYAGWCTKIDGKTSNLSFPVGNLHGFTLCEPMGVVGMILPWNGPLVIGSWKIAPALASGCTCVIKPADITPLSMLYLANLMEQAGLPIGVINVVTGAGSVVGNAIATHTHIDKLAFTGSTSVGRQLIHNSADSNLKPLTLELGGKSPMIVFNDANMELAIKGACDAIFGNAGQVCVAASRLFVHTDIFDSFMKKMAKHAQNIVVGCPFNDNTNMGPVASAHQLNTIENMVQNAVQQGAKILCGGMPISRNGYYYPPTIMGNTTNDMDIAQQEIFGPVVCAMRFDSEAQVLKMANDTPYGLAGSVWTQDIDKAYRIIKKLQAGVTWINTHNLPDVHMPIGGYKQSGWGRELGKNGLDEYIKTKSVIVNLK